MRKHPSAPPPQSFTRSFKARSPVAGGNYALRRDVNVPSTSPQAVAVFQSIAIATVGIILLTLAVVYGPGSY